jgi:hypothetical protein
MGTRHCGGSAPLKVRSGRAYAERLRDGAGALLEAGHAAGAEGRGVGLLGELAQVRRTR